MLHDPDCPDLTKKLIDNRVNPKVALEISQKLAYYAQQDFFCDRSEVDGIVDLALRYLYVQPFTPGLDTEFWLSEAGQCIASALYQAHAHELVSPRSAGRMLWPDAERAEQWLRPHVAKRHLRAIPKPQWAEYAQTKYKRKERGNAARVGWFVCRSEVEEFARNRGLGEADRGERRDR